MAQKLISWNVNGIRATIKKGFEESLFKLDPDVLCLQETKAQDDQVREALFGIGNYHLYSNSAVKKGYSGTAILSKHEPLDVFADMGIAHHDQEGRVLTAEFDKFYLTTVYVPNSNRELSRLDYRQEWDAEFLNFLKKLESKKPVVVCGDFNVAHKDIDLARPKQNYNKAAGFMQEEIDGMDNFIKAGFIDTFRHIYPDRKDAYTWWSYMMQAKEKNIGWRIDYFLASQTLKNHIKDAHIYPDFIESDHCPVGVILEV